MEGPVKTDVFNIKRGIKSQLSVITKHFYSNNCDSIPIHYSTKRKETIGTIKKIKEISLFNSVSRLGTKAVTAFAPDFRIRHLSKFLYFRIVFKKLKNR